MAKAKALGLLNLAAEPTPSEKPAVFAPTKGVTTQPLCERGTGGDATVEATALEFTLARIPASEHGPVLTTQCATASTTRTESPSGPHTRPRRLDVAAEAPRAGHIVETAPVPRDTARRTAGLCALSLARRNPPSLSKSRPPMDVENAATPRTPSTKPAPTEPQHSVTVAPVVIVITRMAPAPEELTSAAYKRRPPGVAPSLPREIASAPNVLKEADAPIPSTHADVPDPAKVTVAPPFKRETTLIRLFERSAT